MNRTLLVSTLLLAAAAANLTAQTAATGPQASPSSLAAENPLAKARVFRYEELPVHTAPNGNQGRNVFSSAILPTGESIAIHESLQAADAVPSPLHTIQHSEMIVILEGTVTFDHDGLSEPAGPGSIIYVAFGTQHRLRNASGAPVRYVVIQVGGDTKR